MNVLWATPIEPSATPGQGTMRRITTEVAERHGLGFKDLIGYGRHRAVVYPRHEAIAEIHATGRFSMPQIGRFFGGRDHSTIWHAVHAHEARKAKRTAQP